MDEVYRMLGREHEADLEREALKWRRAAEVRERPGADAAARHSDRPQKRVHLVLARVAAFVGRAARVGQLSQRLQCRASPRVLDFAQHQRPRCRRRQFVEPSEREIWNGFRRRWRTLDESAQHRNHGRAGNSEPLKTEEHRLAFSRQLKEDGGNLFAGRRGAGYPR